MSEPEIRLGKKDYLTEKVAAHYHCVSMRHFPLDVRESAIKALKLV